MNIEELNIDDFTLTQYAGFLNRVKEKYTLTFFDNFLETKNSLLLRHDVDISIPAALTMAKIENEHNVQSTYLFNSRCSFYNALSPEEIGRIKKIISLGHNIGLHFDATTKVYSSMDELNDGISFEKRLFEKYFEVPIKSMSFHNPTLGNTELYTQHEYCGMINSYSNKWKDVKYNSDSNGYWRHDRLFDLIEGELFDHLQVLLHPVYWLYNNMLPIERIVKCIKNEAGDKISGYIKYLEKNGRKPVFNNEKNSNPADDPDLGINQMLS